jgi:hypothetical protein
MAQEQMQTEEEYNKPFGADDAVLVKDLNFSYGDRQVRGSLLLLLTCSAAPPHHHVINLNAHTHRNITNRC